MFGTNDNLINDKYLLHFYVLVTFVTELHSDKVLFTIQSSRDSPLDYPIFVT